MAASSTGRRKAFRIICGVIAASGIALSLDTVVFGIVVDSQRIHAFHNTVIPTLLLVISVPPVIAAFRAPDRSTVPLAHLVVVSAAGLATMALSLTIDPFTLPVLVAVGAIWVLRPRREPILGAGRVSPILLVLALAAAIPLVAYALGQAELQRTDTSVHADFFHWVETSFTALAIPLLGVLVALRPSRFRVSAWSAGLAAAILGTASLVLSSYASAFDPAWAWAALGGGLLFIGGAEWEGTRARSRV